MFSSIDPRSVTFGTDNQGSSGSILDAEHADMLDMLGNFHLEACLPQCSVFSSIEPRSVTIGTDNQGSSGSILDADHADMLDMLG